MPHLTPPQKTLYKSVSEILWRDFDPLGMSQTGPTDEYESYIPQIFKLLINNESVEKIAEKLNSLEKKITGLNGSIEKCRKVAERLVEAKKKLAKVNDTSQKPPY